mgnify:CR=1 FL=1
MQTPLPPRTPRTINGRNRPATTGRPRLRPSTAKKIASARVHRSDARRRVGVSAYAASPGQTPYSFRGSSTSTRDAVQNPKFRRRLPDGRPISTLNLFQLRKQLSIRRESVVGKADDLRLRLANALAAETEAAKAKAIAAAQTTSTALTVVPRSSRKSKTLHFSPVLGGDAEGAVLEDNETEIINDNKRARGDSGKPIVRHDTPYRQPPVSQQRRRQQLLAEYNNDDDADDRAGAADFEPTLAALSSSIFDVRALVILVVLHAGSLCAATPEVNGLLHGGWSA